MLTSGLTLALEYVQTPQMGNSIATLECLQNPHVTDSIDSVMTVAIYCLYSRTDSIVTVECLQNPYVTDSIDSVMTEALEYLHGRTDSRMPTKPTCDR